MKSLHFYIAAILFLTVNAFAADPVWYDKPLEPKLQYMIKAKDYYKNIYAFDTSEPCQGPSCIPAGSTVGCSKYTLVDAGDGTQVQFCHISTIKYNRNSKEIDISDKDYVMATGFVAENKKFILGLPSGRVFATSRELKKTEGATCDGSCGTAGVGNKISDLAKSLVKAIGPQKPTEIKKQVSDLIKDLVKKGQIARACTNFIDENGELGPWGKKAVEAFHKVDKDCFENGLDPSKICPNFKNFDPKTKEYFRVYSLLSMAHHESSCNVNAINPNASNGTGYGLMQMESLHYRKAGGRDSRFCPHHKINEKDVTFQMECTASIFADRYCKEGLNLSSPKGYWAGLLGPKNLISMKIKKFPGCN